MFRFLSSWFLLVLFLWFFGKNLSLLGGGLGLVIRGFAISWCLVLWFWYLMMMYSLGLLQIFYKLDCRMRAWIHFKFLPIPKLELSVSFEITGSNAFKRPRINNFFSTKSTILKPKDGTSSETGP
jgi:hypothetical protein